MSAAESDVRREFELSFGPKEPSGKGRGKVFEYTDEQFRELYKAAAAVTGAERKRLCDAYHVGYQTLMRKAGVAPAAKRRSPRSAPSTAAREQSIIERIEALADDVDSALESLDEERAELQGRIEEIDRQKDFLRKVAALKGDEAVGEH